jgi:hypothetical protein
MPKYLDHKNNNITNSSFLLKKGNIIILGRLLYYALNLTLIIKTFKKWPLLWKETCFLLHAFT